MNESFAPALREAIYPQKDERHLRDILSRIPKEERAQQVNDPGRRGIPMLSTAAAAGVGLTTALLEAGALVDARPVHNGTTALMVGAIYGHADVVEVLLAHGADPTLVDRKGRTAEDLATGEIRSLLAAHRERPLLRQAAGLTTTTPETDDAPKARRRM